MTIDEKIDLILQHLQKQDKRADAQDRRFEKQDKRFEQQQKVLDAFHTDIEWLKENAATKKDLVNVATKEDLIKERDHNRKIIREEINLNNKILGMLFKIEQAETKKEIVEIIKRHTPPMQ